MRRVLLPLLLAACADNGPAPLPLDDTAALAPPPMYLQGTQTIPGQDFSLIVTSASPNDRVWFVFAPRLGATCPPSFQGVCLDVEQPSILGSSRADGAGTAVFTGRVPAYVPVGSVANFQALVPQGGATYTSNVLTTEAIAQCGDQILQSTETCDDGNTQPGDGCGPTCILESCGDGVLQLGLGEQCDDGNVLDEDGCSATCADEFCGDSVLQVGLGEQCDDGNDLDGDGCSAACADEFCGDGTLQTALGEACDDGNDAPGDGCDADCVVEFCGDGTLQTSLGELCDDGGTVDGDGCSADCLEEFCGDGILQTALGEACDDGDTDDGDGCSATCVEEYCGDGVTQAGLGELCDDGNAVSGDGCTPDCQTEGCGDGIVQAADGEVCDDGNNLHGDGCSANCTQEVFDFTLVSARVYETKSNGETWDFLFYPRADVYAEISDSYGYRDTTTQYDNVTYVSWNHYEQVVVFEGDSLVLAFWDDDYPDPDDVIGYVTITHDQLNAALTGTTQISSGGRAWDVRWRVNP